MIKCAVIVFSKYLSLFKYKDFHWIGTTGDGLWIKVSYGVGTQCVKAVLSPLIVCMRAPTRNIFDT